MRQRITLDPSLAPVRIPGRILNELCAHARETHPEECCGLVTGLRHERFRNVYRCRNDMTMQHRADPATYPRDGREAYYMNELDYLSAQKDAEQHGERVTAVYHSHVGAGAYFSEMDQEFAEQEFFPFPGAAQVVLAVWDGKIKMTGIFLPDPNSGVYSGHALEVSES